MYQLKALKKMSIENTYIYTLLRIVRQFGPDGIAAHKAVQAFWSKPLNHMGSSRKAPGIRRKIFKYKILIVKNNQKDTVSV